MNHEQHLFLDHGACDPLGLVPDRKALLFLREDTDQQSGLGFGLRTPKKRGNENRKLENGDTRTVVYGTHLQPLVEHLENQVARVVDVDLTDDDVQYHILEGAYSV
jgi:hypothetical protein